MSRALALLVTLLAPTATVAQTLPEWAAPAPSQTPAAGGPCGPAPCPPPPPPPVPVEGGLGLLALAGAGLAAHRLRRRG